MKRFCYFIAWMALSSSAHAGDSYSFVVAGHLIQIEAPRHCRAASCVSVSIPGVYRSKRWRDRADDAESAPKPAPVNPPTRAAAPVAPVAAPASQPPVQPVASAPPPPAPPPPAPPPPAPQLASTTGRIVVLPAPPPVPAAPIASAPQTIAPPPPPKPEPVKTTEPPPVVVPTPAPVPAPQISKISQEAEDAPADSPLGDWQTEGSTGTVRIERCGQAMCGYLLNLPSNTRGDTILINMKPKSHTKSDTKSDAVWSGNIYSRSSGVTYYATMTMKGANRLRVEACALGRLFCSGNDWTRIERALITSGQMSPRPPS